MSRIEEIAEAWARWNEVAFPRGWAGAEVAGRDLALLDSLSAGCIQSFVAAGGALGAEKILVLRRCVREPREAVASLDEARDYFRALAALAERTLGEAAGGGDRAGGRVCG